MRFDHFTKVSEKMPPELVDLLVCNLAPEMEDRLYDIAQFARKGSPLKNECRPQGETTEERLLDAVFNHKRGWIPAPATGYYHYVCNEETGLCEWKPFAVDYENSGYMIINPEEEISAMNNIVTCEQVSRGHVDKVCDQIADAIVTDCLRHDENSRVAVECLMKNDELIIAGEITSAHEPNYGDLVEEVFRNIGLDRLMKGINLNVMISKQSPDIAMGVDKGGAGDQGVMYGYATNETEEMLPIPFAVATAFIRKLEDLKCPMLLPDAKAQVSYDYTNKRITTFLCSVQHTEDCDPADFRPVIESLMVLTAAEYGLNTDFVKLVNPTGRFVVGGSVADTGVTGRKLACDTYGGVGRIGGGALSGKDPTKVDRSGAYMARRIAKDLVTAGYCDKCEVQLAYAIGKPEPVSVTVDDFGTGHVGKDFYLNYIESNYDLTPAGIIKYLRLKKVDYNMMSSGGHFGFVAAPWELDEDVADRMYGEIED